MTPPETYLAVEEMAPIKITLHTISVVEGLYASARSVRDSSDMPVVSQKERSRHLPQRNDCNHTKECNTESTRSLQTGRKSRTTSGLEISAEAIRRIALLYKVAKAARGQLPEERFALRQRGAKPVFDALKVWLAAQRNRISGKSNLAKAIRYAPGHMKKCAAIWRSTIIQPSGRSAVWLWVEKIPLCGLQGRRRNGCHRLYCDRNRQAQGCRCPSPARLGYSPKSQPQNHTAGRTVFLA
jgi:hypothetical protein